MWAGDFQRSEFDITMKQCAVDRSAVISGPIGLFGALAGHSSLWDLVHFLGFKPPASGHNRVAFRFIHVQHYQSQLTSPQALSPKSSKRDKTPPLMQKPDNPPHPHHSSQSFSPLATHTTQRPVSQTLNQPLPPNSKTKAERNQKEDLPKSDTSLKTRTRFQSTKPPYPRSPQACASDPAKH
ncbi:unnamed protein product [Aspergillus oryzae]|nr:unnamed protein product [Aspergillus oryzae]GMF92953.1 unnamed protein product [Aspergillus oryzae]